MKKIISTLLIFTMLFSITIYAADETTGFAASSTENKEINKVLEEMILSDYEGIYKFENFDYEYLEDKDSDGYIDVNVYVDMTLVRKPEESPFIIGMQDRSNEILESTTKESLAKEIEFYMDEISNHYLVPERTTFTYSVKDMNDNVSSLSSVGFDVYYSCLLYTSPSPRD